MKDKAPLWLIGSMLFLGLIGGLVTPNAYAGDNITQILSMSVDAGSAVVCTTLLSPNHHYAVSPTVDAYVATCNTTDGGCPTSDNFKIPLDKIYDIWTSLERRYICCKPSADGSASKCKIANYEGGGFVPY